MNGTRKFLTGVLIALLSAALVVLGILVYDTLFPKAYWQTRELETNIAKWNSQRTTHYRFALTVAGYAFNSAFMPITVEVQDDRVMTAYDRLGRTVTPKIEGSGMYAYGQPFTVPGLFAYVRSVVVQHPAILRVDYDPALGYPAEIYVDPWTEPCCQDFWFLVRNFEVLPP